MRRPASLRNLLLSLLIVLFAAACGSPQSKIVGKWADKETPSNTINTMEFFKDGTFMMTEGKKEPRVMFEPNAQDFSGKWIALDDGRIKADLEVFGSTTTLLFVFVGEELEVKMGGKNGRLVRVK